MSTVEVRTPVMIGLRSNGMLMTPEEFDSWGAPEVEWDEDYHYELIHGVLIVSPPADIGELSPNDELGCMIRNYMRDHPNGRSVDLTAPEITIRVGKNRRRCDRAIWCGLGRRPNAKRVPTIAVEFVGPGSRNRKRDYVEKRREYRTVGVREYWIIDRFEQTMTVYRIGKRPLVLGRGDVYRTDLMPGFELPLDRLFAEAEGFGSDEDDED